MKIITAEQGTLEWRQARIGRPTASQFHRIITPSTGKPSTQARRYQCELVYERLYGKPWDKFPNGRLPQAVQDGIDNEPKAAADFSIVTGMELQTIGHVLSNNGRIGCSPDRIIAGKNQALEIKCPTAPVHIEYLLWGPETDYKAQVQGQLLICGFDVVHFYSWHQDFAAKHVEFTSDLDFQNKMLALLEQFCDALDVAEKLVRKAGFWPADVDTLPGFPQPEAIEAA